MLRSGIDSREPCCAQVRCAGIRGIVGAAKGAAHSRYGSHCGRNSQVGSPSEALRQGLAGLVSVWEGLYLSYPFALAASAEGFDAAQPARLFDAILLDIDHSPEMLLDEGHSGFYRAEGLRELMRHLRPGGVFALWSNDKPDAAFTARLASVFAEASAEAVTFDNPFQEEPFTQTVYLARK